MAGLRSRVAITALATALVLLGACGGDDDDAEATASTTTTSESTTTASTEAEPALVDDDLGLEPRSITFANLTYELQAGRVTNQDLRSLAEESEPVVGDGLHVFLEVRVSNETGRQLESDEDAIRLRLDGADAPLAQPFLSEATGFIRAGTTVDSFLAFEVEADTDLEDAVLVFGSAPDRPAELPLVGSVPDQDFPVEAQISGSASGVGPTNGGTIEFEVLGAAAFVDLPHGDMTSPTGERADEGELFLQVHVRATKVEGRGSDLLVDAFRLVEDGVARAPIDVATAPTGSTPSPTVDPGATVDAWVLVLMSPDAGTYELQVGAVDDDPGRIPLDLGALVG